MRQNPIFAKQCALNAVDTFLQALKIVTAVAFFLNCQCQLFTVIVGFFGQHCDFTECLAGLSEL